MNYVEVQLELESEFTEILMAELAEAGFESFVETDEGLQAYIIEEDFNETVLQDLIAKYSEITAISSSWKSLERKNWNEEWERSYEPIEVGNDIRIRATFHEPDPTFTYDLLIQPKMSFGTGHHETTWLVMNEQLNLPHAGLSIMDVGCGTGILAILASKLGATSLLGFDIDEWAVENTVENFSMNGLGEEAEVFKGTINEVQAEKQFGGILANINRNILLEEIPKYVKHLLPGGWLVTSGFYEMDQSDIEKCAAETGLKKLRSNTRNQWATVVFEKEK
ncbi:50S ribosomal protein L11 methyltransferase [Dyadobacter frigoris]|uniref:Ribosomal protein L11 methyltransferase n=1 Tax=Dyadobacter frigoris TaxID=2576211 RepID=A0A4U6D2E1_9BACT|nr:50S ribosomal protein L11 methyltransferase [Dyadobacter frigoris]TKT91332.1 50S ribosomal protein L11 methyltransferase [Dyadobacter frigoris]GLU56340.1 ribosomal protein L11 methyltransferase [Dyadobacter frigoris]